jgi:hypothetical protein
MKSAAIAASAVLAFAAIPAHAEHAWEPSRFAIEAGIGATAYEKSSEATWEPSIKGVSNSTNTVAPAGRIGVVFTPLMADDYANPFGLRIHADYNYLGEVHWTANYANLAKIKSQGHMQAFSLTLEPYWNMGNDWTVGIEAGPALIRNTWSGSLSVLGTDILSAETKPQWRVGAMAGLSVSYRQFSLRYNYIYNPTHESTALDDMQSGLKGAHMVTLNYTY